MGLKTIISRGSKSLVRNQSYWTVIDKGRYMEKQIWKRCCLHCNKFEMQVDYAEYKYKKIASKMQVESKCDFTENQW